MELPGYVVVILFKLHWFSKGNSRILLNVLETGYHKMVGSVGKIKKASRRES